MKKHLITYVITVLVMLQGSTLFAQQRFTITEITIETCSSWQGSMHKYILRSDGSATLIVPNFKSSSAESRAYSGRLYDFARLEQSIDALGFFKLKGSYEEEIYDANTVVVGIVRHGRRYEVVTYGNAGPVSLWAIKELVSGEAKKIKWDKEPDPKPLKYEPCVSTGAPPNNGLQRTRRSDHGLPPVP